MKRTPHGFTLVELMVAMVIFMIICAIAIPNYMSATQRAHEAVAVSFLRQVQTGEEAYHLNNQQYADTFAKLQPYISADLVMPEIPTPGLGFEFVSVAYAEPIPVPPHKVKVDRLPAKAVRIPGTADQLPGRRAPRPARAGPTRGTADQPPGRRARRPARVALAREAAHPAVVHRARVQLAVEPVRPTQRFIRCISSNLRRPILSIGPALASRSGIG